MADVEQVAEGCSPGRHELVNWAPLSEVMIAGTPKQAIQSAYRALTKSAGVMEERGNASSHLSVLSITVKR